MTSKERAEILWPVVHGLGQLHEAVSQGMNSIIAYTGSVNDTQLVAVLREAAAMVRGAELVGVQDEESRELTAAMVDHYADFCEKWVEYDG